MRSRGTPRHPLLLCNAARGIFVVVDSFSSKGTKGACMILWDSSGRGRARAEGVYSNSCFEPFFAADASLPLPNSFYKVVLAIHTMADSGGHFMAKTTLSEDRRRAETAEAGRYSNHHHRRNGREGGRDPGEQDRARGGREERGRGRSSENWEQESAKRTNAKSQNTRGHPIMSDLVRPLQGREGKGWESARAILFFSSVRSRAGDPQADARAPSLPHFLPAPTARLL